MSNFNVTEKPVQVNWPESHYIFVEKPGPFQTNAPAAWQEFHQKVGTLVNECGFVAMASLYKMEPKMIYRAGVMVKTPPKKLPAGLTYERFPGGKYAKFVYTGRYQDLGPVSGKVHEAARRMELPQRSDFYIENYVNDPKTTPEDQLVTEILIPVK